MGEETIYSIYSLLFCVHVSDPLLNEGEAFGVNKAAAEFGHGDVGLGGGDSVREDGCVGVTGDDVVVSATRACACCSGCFEDAYEGGIGLGCCEIQAGAPSTSFGGVTMGAVDFEIGSGAFISGAGVRVIPYGKFGGIIWMRCIL